MSETEPATEGGDGMVIVAGSLTVRPDQIEELLAAAVAMTEASRAEDGCLDYVFAPDTLRPGGVRIFERWRSAAALQTHFGTPHMATFQQVLRGLTVRERDLARYTVASVGPVFAAPA